MNEERRRGEEEEEEEEEKKKRREEFKQAKVWNFCFLYGTTKFEYGSLVLHD